MIAGSEKRNRQLAFQPQNSHVCEKRSNDFGVPMYIIEHLVIEINRIQSNFIKLLKTIEQN